MKTGRFTILSIIPVIFLAACGTPPPPPSPGDTLSRPLSGQTPDWVDTAQVYGPGAEGLEMRDPAFNGAQGGRMEDLLEAILFDYDTSYVKPSERAKLQAAADHLKAHPKDRLLIEGHCDWRGTKEYNLALGDRRATSVERYLAQLGVPSERMETVSFGDLRATDNATEERMKAERRADLVIVR